MTVDMGRRRRGDEDEDEVIDLTRRRVESDEDGDIVYDYLDDDDDDPNVEVYMGAFSEMAPGIDVNRHDANLADALEEVELDRIADELLDGIEDDESSRSEWNERLAEGLKLLGVVREAEDEGAFPGASDVVYPLLAESVVQFQARAMEEIMPPTGPAKGITVGEKTTEKEEQAERVANYMNFQITEADPEWFWETDAMLFYLPLNGSAFKAVYHDEYTGERVSRFVKAEDMLVPYSATHLQNAARYTHRFELIPNDVKRYQASGHYRDIDLAEPNDTESDDTTQEAYDEADGRTDPGGDTDLTYTIFRCHTFLDLPGFEDTDETGEETGVKLPYVVTIERDSRKILRIERDWDEFDPRRLRLRRYVHYKFLPGLGFYGYGYLHLIGNLAQAATGAVRALLDAAAFASMQGGFKAADVKAEAGSIVLEPGVYKDVGMTSDELARAFYTPPYREPSPALYQLLGTLIEAGRGFTGATEALTGTASSTGPVGTMVALIEQGTKVMSGIHKRLHKGQREELSILARLNGIHVPIEGYPYTTPDGEGMVWQTDFDGRVDVIPVSDPNIFSAQQRIAIAQATLELANSAPQLYDIREAHRRMLEALRAPDIDGLLLDPENIPRADPVTENMLMMVGKPAKVYPDQNHQAHIAAHMAFMKHPQFGGERGAAKMVGEAMMAHLAQHAAYLYRQRVMETAGIPAIPIDLTSRRPDDMPEVDPQMDEAIAVAAAQAGEAFLQTTGIPTGDEEGGAQAEQKKAEAELAAKIQAKQAETKAEIQRKDAEAKAEEAREQASFQAEERRKQAAWEAEQKRKDAEVLREAKRVELERKKQEDEANLKQGAAVLEEGVKRWREAAQKKASTNANGSSSGQGNGGSGPRANAPPQRSGSGGGGQEA